jgi:hypothetical protein
MAASSPSVIGAASVLAALVTYSMPKR